MQKLELNSAHKITYFLSKLDRYFFLCMFALLKPER
jgi:hypothetical protein